MKRVRAWFLDNGQCSSLEFFSKKTDESGNKTPLSDDEMLSFRVHEYYQGLTPRIIDWDEWRGQCESHMQLYWEGGKVKVDSDWSRCLMPAVMVSRKTIRKSDADLEKETDPAKVATLLKLKDRARGGFGSVHNAKSIEMALSGLDSRVAAGEPDKPLIRQKLLAKLAELEAREERDGD